MLDARPSETGMSYGIMYQLVAIGGPDAAEALIGRMLRERSVLVLGMLLECCAMRLVMKGDPAVNDLFPAPLLILADKACEMGAGKWDDQMLVTIAYVAINLGGGRGIGVVRAAADRLSVPELKPAFETVIARMERGETDAAELDGILHAAMKAYCKAKYGG